MASATQSRNLKCEIRKCFVLLKAIRRKRRSHKRRTPENATKGRIGIRKVSAPAPAHHLLGEGENRGLRHRPLAPLAKKKLIRARVVTSPEKTNERANNNVSNTKRKGIIAIKHDRKLPKDTITIYENPFKKGEKNVVIDKKKICKQRKEIKQEIFKRSRGKGISIKKAKWDDISKLVRC